MKSVNQDTWQNYPSKLKEKLRYFQINKKLKEVVTTRPDYKNANGVL